MPESDLFCKWTVNSDNWQTSETGNSSNYSNHCIVQFVEQILLSKQTPYSNRALITLIILITPIQIARSPVGFALESFASKSQTWTARSANRDPRVQLAATSTPCIYLQSLGQIFERWAQARYLRPSQTKQRFNVKLREAPPTVLSLLKQSEEKSRPD